mgnify:CR=1 FL=1
MSLEDIKLLLKTNKFDFHYVQEVKSTMTEIKLLTSENNICLMANTQTDGVGRRGTAWISPKGNVYLSLLLKNVLNVKNHFLNTAYTSNIICDVLEKICNIETKIKWPNDILIKDKKVSGIISEIYKKNNEVVLNTGIGINIISSPNINDYPTTCVNEYNKKIDNLKFVFELMDQYLLNLHLLRNYSDSIIEKYKLRLKFFKTNIKLKFENNSIQEGIFYDLNNDGSIRFKTNFSSENIYNARILK